MIKINPFKPGAPIHPGMFVGRLEEIQKIERILHQTKKSFGRNFLIYGERGIGKTSLLQYIKFAANGSIQVEGNKLNFLVVETDITKDTTRKTLINKINLNLKNELGKSENTRKNFETLWSFTKRLEGCGFKLNREEDSREDEVIEEEFSISLAETIKRITTPNDSFFSISASYDGLLLIIDEADKASPDLDLGAFCKLLQERLQRKGVEKMVLGLSGLPEIFSVLYESHQSSLRLFEEIPIKRLNNDEISRVISRCMESARELNDKEMQITADAKGYLTTLSEGFPHFIQQFGHSAFEFDSDWTIDKADVFASTFSYNGALEAIGKVYYKKDFYEKIQSSGYRQVLRIMADNMDSWVAKSQIRERFSGPKGILDNAISALINRKIIIPKEDQKGVYRLQNMGFALWIKLQETELPKVENFEERKPV